MKCFKLCAHRLCAALAALVLMAVMSRALHRKTAAKRAANGY